MTEEHQNANIRNRYTHTLIDAFYENVQGFVVLFRYGRTIDLLDANDRFFSFFKIDRNDLPVTFKKGENQVIDGLYNNSTRFLHRKNGGFELFVTNDESRREYYSVKVMSVDFPANRDFYAICTDISDEKHLHEQLEQEKDRYRIALECASDTLFEYNIKTDIMVTYGVFGSTAVPKDTLVQTPNYSNRLYTGGRVHQDDIEKIVKLLQGPSYFKEEIRVVCRDRKKVEYRWALAEAKTVINDEDGSEKIIGKLTDIHESKMEELKRREMLYIDRVTEAYNSSRMEYLVAAHADFARDEEYAILVLDVDGFTRINEEYGINFGDALLRDLASDFRKQLRKNDVLARIGSDEFMILIKDSSSVDLNEHCNSYVDGVLADYFGNIEDEKVSVSGGYAEKKESEDWQTVATKAVKALRFAKENNRGKVMNYVDLPEKYLSKQDRNFEYMFSEYNAYENSASKEATEIVSFALDVLERNKNPRRAMDVLLMRLIRVYKLVTISIFETDFSLHTSTSLHRVVGSNILENVVIEHGNADDVRSFFSDADEEGFLLMDRDKIESDFKDHPGYARNLPELESAEDICIRFIYNNGVPKGFILFGASTPDTITQESKTKLREIAKIIASQINKTSSDTASQMKSAFLSRMSHEIRTPMNAIIGMTEIASSCVEDTDRVRDSLRKIDKSTKYLLSLINDILDMSKIESGKVKLNIEKVSLSRLVESIDVLVRPQAEEKDIKFIALSDFTDGEVYADEIKLTQVLVNLVGNALKFTKKKGKIVLRIEQMMEEDDTVVYRFMVKDNGIGIDNRNLSRIFQAFEQATDDTGTKFGGTGLGLAISSNLVQLMGGRITVESKPGRGSEFSFTIPLRKCIEHVNEESEKTADARSAQSKGSGNPEDYDFTGRRILIAEDNELNAEIASTILTMAGFETEVTENGKLAVEHFKRNEAGYYDAILMDIRMPVMDGLEATGKIRRSRKADALTVPIIAMTANAFDEDMEKSLQYGMNAHLSKPIDTKLLFQTLAKAFEEN